MKLVLTEDEYENYKQIKQGICPECCGKCLIYKLGLACDGAGDCMLQFFADAVNDEGMDLEIAEE